MMNQKVAIARSKQLFDNGYGCAEAVLMAIAEQFEIESALIPRIATGFCGGVGRTSGMCGAVSGGVLSLSLIFGRDQPEESKDQLNEKIQNFIQSFQAQFGSVNCTDLIGCDLSQPDGPQKFDDLNLHPRCLKLVEDATRLILSQIE